MALICYTYELPYGKPLFTTKNCSKYSFRATNSYNIKVKALHALANEMCFFVRSDLSKSMYHLLKITSTRQVLKNFMMMFANIFRSEST